MSTADERRVLCPVCGAKTRLRILQRTVLRDFPLFCPKCRQESMINVQNLQIEKNRSAGRLDAVLTTLAVVLYCVFFSGENQ